jgi:hypothetical protein
MRQKAKMKLGWKERPNLSGDTNYETANWPQAACPLRSARCEQADVGVTAANDPLRPLPTLTQVLEAIPSAGTGRVRHQDPKYWRRRRST